MLRTLFLQAPSFDGFDGGAGSRYQAKREIRSFWYPTWLAQPAALVAGAKLIDAPPHGTDARRGRAPGASDYDLVVLHTSTPSFAVRREDDRGAEGRQSRPQGRPHRRQGRGRADRQPARRRRRSTSSPATSSTSPSRKSPTAMPGPTIDGPVATATPTGVIVHNEDRADPRGHGQPALRDAGLQARPDDRELLHRLSEAPLHLDLHRPRLQIALHLLPVAADRRRPPLPHPQRRPRDRGDRLGARRPSRR